MQNNCSVTQTVPLACRQIGGLQTLYIGNWPGYGAITYGLTASGEIISFSPTASCQVYEIQQDLEVASVTSVPTVSLDNGTSYLETTITFTIFDMTQANMNIVNAISAGRSILLGLDQNGNYWFYGYKNPCSVTGGNVSTGKALADLNGAQLTVRSAEQFGPVQVTAAAAATILVAAI